MSDNNFFSSIATRIIERGDATNIPPSLLLGDPAEPTRKTENQQLPLWPQTNHAAPSGLLRSALFRVTSKNPAKTLADRKLIASWPDWEIRFTGHLLSQSDLDVWLEILNLAKDSQHFTVHSKSLAFLKKLGRKKGGTGVKWLLETLERLQIANLNITIKKEGKGVVYQSNLIHKIIIPEDTDRHFTVELNPDLAKLFDDGYTKISAQERRMLRGNLAKWLHAFIAGHKATRDYPGMIGIKKLQFLCGATRKGLRFFKHDVKKAMKQLTEIGFIEDFYFEDDILVFIKSKSKKILPERI